MLLQSGRHAAICATAAPARAWSACVSGLPSPRRIRPVTAVAFLSWPKCACPNWVARTDSYLFGRKCDVSFVVTCHSFGPASVANADMAMIQTTITRHGFRAAAAEMRPRLMVGFFIGALLHVELAQTASVWCASAL